MESNPQNVWNICITNYEEYECHALSLECLLEMLHDEWDREFNGLIIGRDVDCVGLLMAFYKGDRAYVAFEDVIKQEWRCSYNLQACERTDWDELVRLTPIDTQEYSFRKCSIIPKVRALRIVEGYLATGELHELYVSGSTGKPIVT